MARRTSIEIAAAAAAQEREACVEFLRDKIVEIEGLAARRRITAGEASLLKRRLDAVADGIVSGLHR